MVIVALLLMLAQDPPPDRLPIVEEVRRAAADIEELTAALRENPRDAERLARRGTLRHRLGDPGAREDFARAVELKPELGPRLERFLRGPRPPAREDVPPGPPERIRAYLERHEPETARRLRQAEEEGRRDDANRILRQAHGRMRERTELKERHPEAFERLQALRALERTEMELAARIRSGPGEGGEEVRKQLDRVLSQLFDLRVEHRAREIRELRRRVEAIEKALDERRDRKREIVEKRREELLRE